MNPRWRRWRGYVDEIEELLRIHGGRMAAADADLRQQYERATWPQGQEQAVGPELVRRAMQIPFLRDLLQEARHVSAERLAQPVDRGFVPWREGERERSRPSARPGLAAERTPVDADSPLPPAPQRLVTAERALAGRTRSIVVVLESPTNPRNAAAVARSAEFLGLQELHLIVREGRTPLQVSVARSCDRYLDLHWYRDTATALERLHERGYRVLAADYGEGAVPLCEVPLHDRVALVLGNEQLGVSAEMRAAADGLFFIPGSGMGAYLNLSTAAAIAMYEIDRRMAESGRRAGLPAEDRDALRRAWYERLGAGNPRRVEAYRRWAGHPPSPDAGDAAPRSREQRRQRERDRRD